jgi:hypothetical protein
MITKNKETETVTRIIFTTFLVWILFSNIVYSQRLANNIPPEKFAQRNKVAIPQIFLWHFNLLVVEPKYYEELNAAKREKYDKLKLGETVTFLIIGEQVGDTRFFKYLIKEGTPRLDSYKVMGKVTISKSQYVLHLSKLPPLTNNDFDKFKKLINVSELTYDDHLFATEAINALHGKNSFIDLLDPIAHAISEGTIILIAKKDESAFQVFDIDTNKPDAKKYPKGEFVESMGNTVWLYSKINGREYTTIYSHLDNIQIDLGSKVKQAETIIGKWQKEKTNISIWRTHGKQQRFLRNNPYCILPVATK